MDAADSVRRIHREQRRDYGCELNQLKASR